MDELNLELDDLQDEAEKTLQVKDRFAKLTEKGIEAERKAQEEASARAGAESRASKAEKDLEFYKSFSQISSKFPGAVDHQDQIKERVDRGYDPEDAVIAVLSKEGKLNQTDHPTPQPNVAGGSAQTNLGDGGSKDIRDMNNAEKAEALMQMEREGANLLRF